MVHKLSTMGWKGYSLDERPKNKPETDRVKLPIKPPAIANAIHIDDGKPKFCTYDFGPSKAEITTGGSLLAEAEARISGGRSN